jgi:hypothetical protein
VFAALCVLIDRVDILENLVSDSSVWIKNFIYELTEFRLRMILVNDPESMNETVQIVFPDVISFDETIEEYDNSLIDSLIGIHWLEDAATICIKTEIREIFIKTTTQPYVEKNT